MFIVTIPINSIFKIGTHLFATRLFEMEKVNSRRCLVFSPEFTREVLQKGEEEVLLREVGDGLSLGKLLCSRGWHEAGTGDNHGARSALVEAEALAEQCGAGPESELGRKVSKLRDALAEDPGDLRE